MLIRAPAPGRAGRLWTKPQSWPVERCGGDVLTERCESLRDVGLIIDRLALQLHPGMCFQRTACHSHADSQLAGEALAAQEPVEQQGAREAGDGREAMTR